MIDKAHELDPNDPEIFLSWVYTLDLPERAKQVKPGWRRIFRWAGRSGSH